MAATNSIQDPSTNIVQDLLTNVIQDPLADIVQDLLTNVIQDPLTNNVQDPLTNNIQNPSNIIQDLLAETKTYRHVGVKEGLIKLEKLNGPQFTDEEIGLPILRPMLESDPLCFPPNTESYPTIFNFPMMKFGLVLAGGALVRLMQGKKPDDWDFFLVGRDAITAIHAFLEYLVALGFKGAVYRSEGCVTIVGCRQGTEHLWQSIKIQIVLRAYNTMAEILHGFDLGSCQFAFDGEDYYTTPLGKFALEHNLNILDLDMSRPTYKHRIDKYFDRGFGIVMPKLDMNKVSERMRFDDSLEFYMLEAGPNVITGTFCDCSEDYGEYDLGLKYEPLEIQLHNLKHGNIGVVALKAGLNVTEINPTLCLDILLPAFTRWCCYGQINAKKLEYYLGTVSTGVLINAILAKNQPVREMLASILKTVFEHKVTQLPFVLRDVTDATMIGDKEAVITEKMWYGDLLASS